MVGFHIDPAKANRVAARRVKSLEFSSDQSLAQRLAPRGVGLHLGLRRWVGEGGVITPTTEGKTGKGYRKSLGIQEAARSRAEPHRGGSQGRTGSSGDIIFVSHRRR